MGQCFILVIFISPSHMLASFDSMSGQSADCAICLATSIYYSRFYRRVWDHMLQRHKSMSTKRSCYTFLGAEGWLLSLVITRPFVWQPNNTLRFLWPKRQESSILVTVAPCQVFFSSRHVLAYGHMFSCIGSNRLSSWKQFFRIESQDLWHERFLLQSLKWLPTCSSRTLESVCNKMLRWLIALQDSVWRN